MNCFLNFIVLLVGVFVVLMILIVVMVELYCYEFDLIYMIIVFMVDYFGYVDMFGVFLEFEGGFIYDMDM